MKKRHYLAILVSITLTIVSGCAATPPPVNPADLTFSRVYEIPEYPAEEIYEGIKMWIAENFRSAKSVIEYENRTDKVLIGNGSFETPMPVGFGAPIKVGSTFTMRTDVKDGKFKLTFLNLGMRYGYNDRPIMYQAQLEAMKPNLNGYGDRIVAYLQNNSNAKDW